MTRRYPKYDPSENAPYCVNTQYNLRLTLDITADNLADMSKVLAMLAREFEGRDGRWTDPNTLGMAHDCDYEYDILEN